MSAAVVERGGPAGASIASRRSTGALADAGVTVIDAADEAAARAAVEDGDLRRGDPDPGRPRVGSAAITVVTLGLDPLGEAAQLRGVSARP